jgi:hypothetical protein
MLPQLRPEVPLLVVPVVDVGPPADRAHRLVAARHGAGARGGVADRALARARIASSRIGGLRSEGIGEGNLFLFAAQPRLYRSGESVSSCEPNRPRRLPRAPYGPVWAPK